jgi:hypothetical protein
VDILVLVARRGVLQHLLALEVMVPVITQLEILAVTEVSPVSREPAVVEEVRLDQAVVEEMGLTLVVLITVLAVEMPTLELVVLVVKVALVALQIMDQEAPLMLLPAIPEIIMAAVSDPVVAVVVDLFSTMGETAVCTAEVAAAEVPMAAMLGLVV